MKRDLKYYKNLILGLERDVEVRGSIFKDYKSNFKSDLKSALAFDSKSFLESMVDLQKKYVNILLKNFDENVREYNFFYDKKREYKTYAPLESRYREAYQNYLKLFDEINEFCEQNILIFCKYMSEKKYRVLKDILQNLADRDIELLDEKQREFIFKHMQEGLNFLVKFDGFVQKSIKTQEFETLEFTKFQLEALELFYYEAIKKRIDNLILQYSKALHRKIETPLLNINLKKPQTLNRNIKPTPPKVIGSLWLSSQLNQKALSCEA